MSEEKNRGSKKGKRERKRGKRRKTSSSSREGRGRVTVCVVKRVVRGREEGESK